jgi:hypothetical protein
MKKNEPSHPLYKAPKNKSGRKNYQNNRWKTNDPREFWDVCTDKHGGPHYDRQFPNGGHDRVDFPPLN